MTYLPANVMGRWFHLYLILDLYSRKIVVAEVHDSDDADHAVHLVRRTALAKRTATRDTKPVLHGDNGSMLKATTALAMLQCGARQDEIAARILLLSGGWTEVTNLADPQSPPLGVRKKSFDFHRQSNRPRLLENKRSKGYVKYA